MGLFSRRIEDSLFPISNNNKLHKGLLYQSDKISEDYLNETAPGYIEKEVQYNKEKLRTKISSQVPYLIKGFNQVNQLNHIHQGRF